MGSSLERLQSQQARMDQYVRSVAGGSAGEIERAKGLLDSGAITQAEFDSIKAKALGGWAGAILKPPGAGTPAQTGAGRRTVIARMESVIRGCGGGAPAPT